MLVLVAVGWRVVGAALAPVEQLRAGAERITGSATSERLPVPREAEGVVDGGLRQHGEIHAEVPHRIEDQLDEGMGRVPERIDVCDGIRNEDRQGRGGKRPDEKRPRPAGRPQQPDEGTQASATSPVCFTPTQSPVRIPALSQVPARGGPRRSRSRRTNRSASNGSRLAVEPYTTAGG